MNSVSPVAVPQRKRVHAQRLLAQRLHPGFVIVGLVFVGPLGS